MNKLLMNKKIIAGAIALTISPTFVHADVFNMYSQEGLDLSYSPGGTAINVDNTISRAIDLGAGTWGVSSTAPFYGLTWTATNGTLIQSPGSYALDTVTGTVTAGTGPVAADGTMYFNVGTNQIAGIIDFAWSTSTGIRVINVWDVNCNRSGSCSFDTVLVPGMENGPFGGFNAAFELTLAPVFTVDLQVNQGASTDISVAESTAGSIDIVSNINEAGATFNWDNDFTDAAIIALAGGTETTDTLSFNPATLSAGTYNVSITATSASGTVRADHTFNLTPIALGATDVDGDGTDDATEGFVDSDNDGIPDYLDHSGYTDPSVLQMMVSGDNSTAPVMTASTGTLRVGDTARNKYNIIEAQDFYNNGTGNGQGPIVEITDMVADVTISSCIGGCFDFEVSGITTGSSVQVTIPLSAAIPQNPVYRKFNPATSKWSGFALDDANSIASAPALSSGPITCPSPGSAAYTSGLTVGNYCVQLTIQDNGPNDRNSADGTIADPGGIASTDQSNLEDTSPSIDGVGGGWWFLMGIPALIGLRRFTNSK